uniref:Uncharacterized protein n=1 Tax=Mesocestoides corti TaxID=53468 RepID=A0A5K3FZX0_MESCO
MITGNGKVDFVILRHTTTATQQLNPRSDAPSAAQTIHTTNHRQLTSASQAVCPQAVCPRSCNLDLPLIPHLLLITARRRRGRRSLLCPHHCAV